MMKQLSLFFILAFIAACVQKEKAPEITEIAAPTPIIKPENLILRTARASMKAVDNTKVAGIIHFAQGDKNLKTELQLEGLQSGPYEVHISANASCKKLSMKNHKDVAQVIADKNGVVKTTIELINTSAQDLIGKTLVLHNKSKRFPRIAACGLIEKI